MYNMALMKFYFKEEENRFISVVWVSSPQESTDAPHPTRSAVIGYAENAHWSEAVKCRQSERTCS